MSFDDLLKTLQKDYLDSIPQKIEAIRAQISEVSSGTASTSQLRESFHKLKGTGRTYGLPEVSELAELVEDVCSTAPRDAVQAATHALAILQDIHSAHSQSRPFDLHQDERFRQISKR